MFGKLVPIWGICAKRVKILFPPAPCPPWGLNNKSSTQHDIMAIAYRMSSQSLVLIEAIK
jgi:hypothetical protein